MSTNGKPKPPEKVEAVAVCRRCELGVFAVLIDGEWHGVEGDTSVFLQLEVHREYGLCRSCHQKAGQEFVL